MVINPALFQFFQSLGTLGFVSYLINIIAPWLERTKWCAPSSSVHDATLRALNLVLNVGLALGIAWPLGQLTSGQQVLLAIGFGIAQATGSHVLYTSGNRPAPSAPTPSAASAAPAAPAAPSLATLAAPAAASVASAINDAIAKAQSAATPAAQP